MHKKTALPNKKQLVDENAGLRMRLEESEETLRAIRSGEVDAIVVSGVGGEQVFTLTSAERPYRALIEDMKDGAITLTSDGVILYANCSFAEMVKTPLEKVIGSTIHTWIAPIFQGIFQALFREDTSEKSREELVLTSGDGTLVPVSLSMNPLIIDGIPDCFGLVAIDLTEQKRSNEALLAAEKAARELLQERHRLAHDLHDAINQTLFSASLIAEVLPRLWDKDQVEARRSLEDLRRLTKGALAEMRGLLAELNPSTPDGLDLGDLLRQLGEMLHGQINTSVAFHIIGKFILPTKVQLVFYRVCQKALENAVILNASQVEISLQYIGDVIELRIRDNGRIFDSEQAHLGYPGLDTLVEHAEAIGAQLKVNSRPGYGTEVMLGWQAPQKWTT
jgi:PAS domain S-box-containing protein